MRTVLAAVPLALVALGSAANNVGGDAGAPALPACVHVATASRYVPFGYDHIVAITNGCSRAATCTITTDVNPQPSVAEVASGATVEVVTFMASPHTTFVAHVTCTLHGAT